MDVQAIVERFKSLENRIEKVEIEHGWRARAEAAEAEAARWRELHADRDRDLAHEFARANAAEAECERLRERLDACLDVVDRAVDEIAEKTIQDAR